ncbi:MAG: amidohydrolase [Anaerolineales bacterium]
MPDLCLLNANVYTLDPQRPRAQAIAIRDEKIIATGTNAEIESVLPDAPSLDLQGRLMLPGLIDAHMHMEWYALGLQMVNAETETLDECLQRVAERAAITPRGEWIRGHGWNQTRWSRLSEAGFPTAADLDAVAAEHPVYLTAKSSHAGWANSVALKLAGLTANTPDPHGGEIQHDLHGQPTGILFETAMILVDSRIPMPSVDELADAMHVAQETLWRYGHTGVHDFDGKRSLAAWQVLRERGELGLRVCKTIRVAYLDHAIGLGLRSGFGDDWIRLGNVKVFMDGALGPRTARMIEPYIGEPENYGITVTDPEELYEQAAKAAANGLAMTVHAIGDKAGHDLLNVYEKLRDSTSGGDAGELVRTLRRHSRLPRLRQRYEHVQILHPNDFNRLGELGVIASMQPIHATSDMLMAEKFWGARNAGAYAWRTQISAGAVLAFGSDAPIEIPNPLEGIHAAVTRRRADGSPGSDGWYPAQRLTVEEAVRGYTLGAAYAGYMENKIGSLAAGKLADLIVIDRDIFICDPMAIKDTQVLGTMVGGEWKYRGFEN